MDITSYLLGKNASGGGPTPTGTINITENGEHDVTNYATANVNVSGGGGDLSAYFDTEVKSNTSSSNYLKPSNIVKKIPPFTVDDTVTSLSYCFYYYQFAYLDISQMDLSNISNLSSMCASANGLLEFHGEGLSFSTITNTSNMFENCSNIIKIYLPNATLNDGYSNRTGSMFNNCKKLAILDISSLNTNRLYSNFSSMFTNCGINCLQSDGAYADGIPYVYVKDTTAQNWVLTQNNGHPSTWTTANVVIKSN